jgi:hypothetical protein
VREQHEFALTVLNGVYCRVVETAEVVQLIAQPVAV